ncbi:MAG: OmpA family protein [Rhodobacteraceae bacterium]|nr:OmpA family protein [Paracoccaceae bacterium]
MKRIYSVVLAFWAAILLSLPAAAQVRQMPLDADRCAIKYALTLQRDPACPMPVDNGLTRAVSSDPLEVERADIPTRSVHTETGYFIHFDFASDTLAKEYQDHLASLAEVLNSGELSNLCIKLVGHTDTVGPAKINKALSEKRAASVRTFMTDKMAVRSARILTEGAGESKVLEGLKGTDPLNRRVEVLAKHNTFGTCSTG